MFWEIFTAVLKLLAGIGIFLVGIVMFSEGLEKNASRGMRALFKKISNRKSSGILVGAGVTALIQSSSATTVMVIGLVNAGIITLIQATAIIMGANIGTTVTGLIVSMPASVTPMFMALAFVGAMIKIITKKEKAVRIADLLISFGILFIGLDIMGAAFKGDNALKTAFQSLFENVTFPLLLVLLGAVFTGIIQSSSAATGIFITMIGSGLLKIDSAIYLVLGANIGTCVTALLASITANTNAKRAALIHILFNVLGAVIFLAIIWPLAGVIMPVYTKLIPDPKLQLSVFHIIFNLSTTLILVWFIKPLNRLTHFLVKEKPDDEDIMRTTFIDERLLTTPAIALDQTIKEIDSMAGKARDNINLAFNAVITQDFALKEKILKGEDKIDFLNQSLARYLVKLSASPKITYSTEKLIGAFHHVINDLERIGDHSVSIMYDAISMKENDVKFSDAALDELKGMYQKLAELAALSSEVFLSRNTKKLKAVSALNKEIDAMRDTLTNSHVERLTAGKCTVEAGGYFYGVLMAFKRVSDHLTNVAFSIRSYTGNETEVFKKLEDEKTPAQPKKN